MRMLQSIKANKKGILLMLLSSGCACVGQLMFKLYWGHEVALLVIGLGLYGFGALLMIIAYKFGKVSILQPLMSVNYIIGLILGALLLNEQVTIAKCIGVTTILFGVFLIAGSDV